MSVQQTAKILSVTFGKYGSLGRSAEGFPGFSDRSIKMSLYFPAFSGYDSNMKSAREKGALTVGRYDLGRALVEGIISRALKDMENDSRRTARNLVDLGLTLARGPFERMFLNACRQVLEDDESVYYPMLERALREFDRQSLITFGINAGFEGCSRGAKRIREIEGKRGFNIPWTIRLAVGRSGLSLGKAEEVIAQAVELGIHVFRLVDCRLEQEDLTRLLQKYPTCAFVLFTTGDREPQWDLEALSNAHGLLFSVAAQSFGADVLCNRLARARMPYAVHLDYDDHNAGDLPRRLESLQEFGCPMVILRGFSASQEVRRQVNLQVIEARTGGAYPFVPIDLPADLLAIDQVISSDACHLTFLPDGRAMTHRGITESSILALTLEEILAKELPKGQSV